MTRRPLLPASRLLEFVIVAALLLFLTFVVTSTFERIPIEGTTLAIDWQSIYQGIKGGQVIYRGGSLMIAPWTLPVIVPMGLFSMQASWGLISLLTILVLVTSVPRRGRHIDLLSVA